MSVAKKNPIIPPLKSDPGLKEYRCPYCGRFLFRGHVQRLKMSCPHCQRMIDSDANDSVSPVGNAKTEL